MALKVADSMKSKEVSVEVIIFLTFFIESARRPVASFFGAGDGRWSQCGNGSEIASILMEASAFHYLDASMERVPGAGIPMP
jgi:pyruvate/2-oxoglutarate/acetoin dehydrogenase E1 component